jgi:hypothetical protein
MWVDKECQWELQQKSNAAAVRTREALELAGARLFVEPLGVALLAQVQRHLHEDLDEAAGRQQGARAIAVGAAKGAGQGCWVGWERKQRVRVLRLAGKGGTAAPRLIAGQLRSIAPSSAHVAPQPSTYTHR